MKRRQFLKMIPVGLLSGFIPGFLKADPYPKTGKPFMLHVFKPGLKRGIYIEGFPKEIIEMEFNKHYSSSRECLFKTKGVTYD